VNLRPVRRIAILTLGLAVPLVVPVGVAGAPAAPIGDLEARAAQLESDLNAANSQVAAVGEQLAAAQDEVDAADARIADAGQRIEAGEARVRELKALLAQRAAAIYRTAGTSSPLEAINAQDATDAGMREKYNDAASAKDDELVDQLGAARQDLERQRDEASAARETAAKQRDELQAAKDAADAAAAEQQGLLDQVQGEMEQALRQLTAQRAASAPKVGGTSGGGGGPPGLGHGGAGAAAGYASAQVGKPYCNTNPDRFGPNCYDCSGLTYSAWRSAGLTIPAVSGGQGSAFPHVPLGDLQPGDLITTSSWGAHVGIWVGGGYVHATKPGDVVKSVGGTGSVIDAVRPG
jgi:cell wall-associated NlpC family hydrolase